MDVIRLVVGPYKANCYILNGDGELNIIDPGGEADKITQKINELNKLVKFIINTHYHFDHTGANAEIKEQSRGLGTALLIHEREKEYIDFSPDRFLQDGEKLGLSGVEFEVLPTPGHTAGSFCLISKDTIFTGDTLFKDGYGRTDLPGGSDDDMAQSLALLKKKIRPGMEIYPGHGDFYVA